MNEMSQEAAAAALNDPALPQETLQQIAVAHPELWDRIAQHPNVYPALTEWIRTVRGQPTAATPQQEQQTTPADQQPAQPGTFQSQHEPFAGQAGQQGVSQPQAGAYQPQPGAYQPQPGAFQQPGQPGQAGAFQQPGTPLGAPYGSPAPRSGAKKALPFIIAGGAVVLIAAIAIPLALLGGGSAPATAKEWCSQVFDRSGILDEAEKQDLEVAKTTDSYLREDSEYGLTISCSNASFAINAVDVTEAATLDEMSTEIEDSLDQLSDDIERVGDLYVVASDSEYASFVSIFGISGKRAVTVSFFGESVDNIDALKDRAIKLAQEGQKTQLPPADTAE